MFRAFTNFTSPLALFVRSRSCHFHSGFVQERGEYASALCADLTLGDGIEGLGYMNTVE